MRQITPRAETHKRELYYFSQICAAGYLNALSFLGARSHKRIQRQLRRVDLIIVLPGRKRTEFVDVAI